MKEQESQFHKTPDIQQKQFTLYITKTAAPSNNDIELLIEDKFIKKARAIIEKHIDDEHFDLHQLYRELGIGRAQLHRKLKAITRRSSTSFINGIRLQKAKELLATTELNVSEVAYLVGFRDPSYFSRCYFNEFGMRPSGRKRKR